MSSLLFSEKLCRLMSAKKVTQAQVADAVGVTQGAVSNWLKGAEPKTEKLPALADFFGVPVGALLVESYLDRLAEAPKERQCDFDEGMEQLRKHYESEAAKLRAMAADMHDSAKRFTDLADQIDPRNPPVKYPTKRHYQKQTQT